MELQWLEDSWIDYRACSQLVMTHKEGVGVGGDAGDKLAVWVEGMSNRQHST